MSLNIGNISKSIFLKLKVRKRAVFEINHSIDTSHSKNDYALVGTQLKPYLL